MTPSPRPGRGFRVAVERDVKSLAPMLGRRRSWWLRDALAADPGEPALPLHGSATADVAIVGGGFTGLWTAWQLIERSPGIRVTIVEQDIVGGGPSGRNGGFVNGWWDSLSTLVRLFGETAAVAAAEAIASVPADIGGWCERNAVDAWFLPAGMLLAPSSDAQMGAYDEMAELGERLGHGDRFVRVGADEMRRRSGSPALREGVLIPGEATVHPARLARGLRRVLLERGVTIHEGTRVRRVSPSSRPVVEADGGSISADRVVLALNAWAAGWPGFGRRLVTWSSYIVLTEPIPDRLAEIGWTGGEGIADARFTLHYFRTTADGRIAFGGGGGRAGYGGRIGGWTTDDIGSVRLAASGFRRLYPQLADVVLEDAWGGPIDVASGHLPSFGATDSTGRILYGHGYSGNGVGPSHLGGRILAALALGQTDDPLLQLPVVEWRPRSFPPEPFRYIGARVIREAIVAAEEREDHGRSVPRLLKALGRLPRRLGYELGPE